MQLEEQKITRKRQRRVQNHKKAKRKTPREAGQAYVSSTGKNEPAKMFTDSICGCSKKCNSSTCAERREQIFENLYSLDWSLKNAFIGGQIIVPETARKYTQSATSRRANTRSYYLPDEQGHPHEVCKTYFKDTANL
jgi:hypothetical protein